MVSIDVHLQTTEPVKRFLDEQCRQQHGASIADYILDLIERERIELALEEGLDSPQAPFDPEELKQIKRSLQDQPRRSEG